MTNHAQEATEWIEVAEDAHTPEEGATLLLRAAQVHATLALVEQQRIANLISLARLGDHTILSEQVSADAADSLVEYKKHTMGGYFQLNPEIAAALGITEES